jgi:membrane protease YdiL (CAAX protease family)
MTQPSGPSRYLRPLGPLAAVSWVVAFVVAFVLGLAILGSIRGQAIDEVSIALLEAAAAVGVMYGIARVHAPDAALRDILGARPIGFLPILAAALMGGFAVAPLGELHARILQHFPLSHQHATDALSAYAGMTRVQRVGGVLAMSTLGPVVEELVFRGAIATGVERAAGRVTAAATSVVAFALFYGLFEPRQLAIGGSLAVMLVYARFAGGSVLTAIAAHLAFRCADMAHDFRVFGTLDPLVTVARPWPPTLLIGGTIATLVLAAILPRLGGAVEEERDPPAPPAPPPPASPPPPEDGNAGHDDTGREDDEDER